MLTLFFRRAAPIMCCLSLLFSTSALSAAKPEAGQQKKVQMDYTYRATTLLGMEVKNREGTHIGKLEDLLIDARDGQVRCGILSFGGILGIGDKLFPIPWHELTLRIEENKAFLVADVSTEFLKTAPSFARNEWPDMTPKGLAFLEAMFRVHSGRLLSVSRDHLVMTLGDFGKTEHSHPVASNAVVTRDGATVALTDLKNGDRIKVTTEEEAGIRVVTRVDAQSTPTTD
jgi:sporulation protein YlmC with PRC-barrel domain